MQYIFFRHLGMAGRILLLQPGIEPVSPALEAWCLNHWTTREVPPLPITVLPKFLSISPLGSLSS